MFPIRGETAFKISQNGEQHAEVRGVSHSRHTVHYSEGTVYKQSVILPTCVVISSIHINVILTFYLLVDV